MRIIILICFAILFLGAIQLSAGAEEGKDLFVSKCGQCHKTGGSAPAFAPKMYAADQWKRFFEKDKHAKKKDIKGMISADEIKSITKYLSDHAADSPRPESAGLK